MESSRSADDDVPPAQPTHSTLGRNYARSDQQIYIPLVAGGPPYLPPLVRGQEIQSGPYVITVTDSMVLERERQNQEIDRAWLRQHRGYLIDGENTEEYFAEFKEASVRRKFIRNVFFILFLQILFTTCYVAFFMFHQPAKQFITKHWWTWMIAMILFMSSYCSISITDCGRRQSKWGATCLIILTFAESHLSAYVSAQFEIEIVLIALGITTVTTIIVSLVAAFSKLDFTRWAGLLSILGLVAFIALIILMITIMYTNIPVLVTLFGAFGALLFSLYLYFDIQTIMGGRKIQLSPDELIFATTQLYVDIIGLYRYILLAIGSFTRD